MKSTIWNTGTVKVRLVAACPYCQWIDELEIECAQAPYTRCFVMCESCETLFLVELSGEREIRTFRVEPRIEIVH